MLKSRIRSLVPLFALACVLAGAVTPVSAGTVKFPLDEPTFVVDLPEGWTSKKDKDGNLDCKPADNSDYYLGFILMPNVHTKAGVKENLPKIVKAMAGGAKATDLEIGDIEDSKNGKDVPFSGLRADGKITDEKGEKVPIVMILHAFEPQKGKWYVIMTMGSEKDDKAHNDDYDSIYDSIQPLK